MRQPFTPQVAVKASRSVIGRSAVRLGGALWLCVVAACAANTERKPFNWRFWETKTAEGEANADRRAAEPSVTPEQAIDQQFDLMRNPDQLAPNTRQDVALGMNARSNEERLAHQKKLADKLRRQSDDHVADVRRAEREAQKARERISQEE